MRWPFRFRRLPVLLASLVALPAIAPACEMRERARIPLEGQGGLILVTVMINDRPARMVLDTGAARSVVTRDAVRRLDLALDEWVATTMRGVGGVERNRNALPRSITLGGVKLERRTRTRDTSLTVGTLPDAAQDGLLGRDFLSLFDLDLDLPNRVVRLVSVAGCQAVAPPWPHLAVPVTNPADSALVVGVTLDGLALRALLDTGATTTVLAAPGMARMGLTPETLARTPRADAAGLGPRTVTGWAHRFRGLTVGPVQTADPVLWVAPVRLTPIVDMLLGADWLASRRVWISFTTRQLFAAPPSGG